MSKHRQGSSGRARKALSRSGVATAVIAGALAAPASPSSASFSRTVEERPVSVPQTRAATLRAEAGTRVRLAWPATHVAFSWTGDHGSALRYRTWPVGGEASPWRPVPESHDMSGGGTHYSAMISTARADSVEWRADEPGARDVEVHYLNTVDGPRQQIARPARRQIGQIGPGGRDIVTRAEWGADESIKRTTGDCDRRFWPVQQLFVHHTAGINNDPHPKATMRAIYHYHTVTRGWCDIGYNFVIGPDGRLFEGRWARRYAPWELHTGESVGGRAVAGAHVADFNSGSIGVSLMGNLSTAPLGAAARRTLVRLLAWEADRHNLDPRAMHTYRNPDTGLVRRLHTIAGHRDAGQTACPGSDLYARLPELRRRVASVIGDGKRTSDLSLEKPGRIVYGDEVRLSGFLTTGKGRALVGRKVIVFGRPSGSQWSRGRAIHTGARGLLALRLAPARNTSVRAVYTGGPHTWGSQSKTRRIYVAPRITLALKGGWMSPAGVRHFPAGTTSVALRGAVGPAHAHRRVVISVYKVSPSGLARQVDRVAPRLTGDSRYSAAVAARRPGRYRVVAAMAAHADHAAGSSPARSFVIDGT